MSKKPQTRTEPAIGAVIRWHSAADSPEPGLGIVLALDGHRIQVVDVDENASSASPPRMAVSLSLIEGDGTPAAMTGVVTPLHTRWVNVRQCHRVGSADPHDVDRLFRAQVDLLARSYYDFSHQPTPFVPGETPILVAGRCYGPEEIGAVMETGLDFWLTIGRFNEAFEQELARRIDVTHCITTNSGSSANLLAVSALTSQRLGNRRLTPGNEIITVAAGFPTTVNPILQNGLVPVFVDIDPHTYNVIPERLEAAIGPNTRAIILAHTLGNPFDIGRVLDIARTHDLWLIEDCCDALGSRYALPPGTGKHGAGPSRPCGSFGHMATFSFFPAHHITMGEGGAVATDDGELKRILLSFRDWGRDCRCPPGRDNVCGRRFQHQMGDLPMGYDHKYIYSHLGYNLKITEMQAAVGLTQLNRLDDFHRARQRNFNALKTGLQSVDLPLLLPEPTSASEPSWFGFPMTLTDPGGSRERLLAHLHDRRIATRLLFGGNLARQPYMRDRPYRVVGDLSNTDRVMTSGFWLGVYPGITEDAVAYTVDALKDFFRP